MSHPASTNSPRCRQKAQVNPRLDTKIAAYMAAATAAGVSLLAAQSAEAKIVYTPANITIGPRTSVPLDLTNDGVNDFVISNWQYDQVSHLDVIHQAPANGVISKNQELGPAADLPLGAQIGPNRFFEGTGSMATQGSRSGIAFSGGPWHNAHNRYLGLRFLVEGKTHYGWARLTVTTKGEIAATITGYAYETVPDRPIIAGKTSGPEVVTAVDPGGMLALPHVSARPQSANLDMLARGADALAVWRRDEESAAPA